MARATFSGYCERVGPELWAEPLNAVTNLAFIAAAVVLARMLARAEGAGRHDPACWVLVALIFLIGIGSGLFHTFAVGWAALADVIPIALFILLYTWFALVRFAAVGVVIGLLGVVAVIGLAAAIPLLTGFGGGTYAAALLTLIAVGFFLYGWRRHPAGSVLLWAAAVFAVSLTLRTLDQPLCSAWPLGTHFAWHLLNAVVLTMVTRAMIRFGRPAPDDGAGIAPKNGTGNSVL